MYALLVTAIIHTVINNTSYNYKSVTSFSNRDHLQ